jgi:hypothetical protein
MPTPVTAGPGALDRVRRTLSTSFTDGVPVNIVQKVMGHQQPSTTLNRYTHTPDDYENRVVAAFCGPADFSLTPTTEQAETEDENEEEDSL